MKQKSTFLVQIRLNMQFQIFIPCSSWNYYFKAILTYEAKIDVSPANSLK